MRTLACVCSVVLLVTGISGCGGPAGRGGGAGGDAKAPKTRKISTANLPQLADPMPPVDEGRLEIAPPKKWHIPPRNPKWLARFQADPGSPYPMIFVTVDSAENLFHVTRDNLDELAEQVRKELRADPDTKQLAAGVQPVTIGDFRGVLYRRWGRTSGRVMERWMLETVANGRRYTVELRAREGLAEEYQPQLFAVASGMKFSQGDSGGSGIMAVEETPEPEAEPDEATEKPADAAKEDEAKEDAKDAPKADEAKADEAAEDNAP